MKPFFKIILQIGIIVLFWLLGNQLSGVMHSTIPGSIWGIFLLVLALSLKIVRLDQVEEGASAILKDLIFLFLPLVMTVMKYQTLFITEGWKLVVSIFIGTVLVMVSTSLTIHLLYRFKRSRTA